VTDPQAAPRTLTDEQERHWRADIEADRWGSKPRWSSQSVAALFATLDEARSLVPAQEPIVDSSCDCKACTDRTTEMYDVPGGCSNCGARFTVRSRKGDKTPLSVDCPSCEATVYGWRAE
jgi:hypothetical protein